MGLHIFKAHLNDLELTASNMLPFQDADTIPCDSTSAITSQYFHPAPGKAFRYWCFSNNKRRFLEFADIVFISTRGEFIKGNVNPIYSSGFDGNALTNSPLPIGNKIIVDFENPVEIAQIICIPRSDGNGIYPHEEYELFYHDLKGWQSLGRKTATDCHIEFENVPAGALYWLHNHTTGIEERVFTVEKGQVRFW